MANQIYGDSVGSVNNSDSMATRADTIIYTQDQVNALVAARVADINASNTSTIQAQAQQLAQQLYTEMKTRDQLANQLANNGKMFNRFATDDIVSDIKTKISTPVWSGPTGSLSTFWTSSTQPSSSRQYYVGVYNTAQSLSTSELQFAIAYGNYYGSGSYMQNGDSPSRAVYYQYRNILIADSVSKFQLGNSAKKQLNSIYVLSIARNRLKDKLDPGNWELAIRKGAGSTAIQLIDDSNSNTTYTVGSAGRIFNIISGSIYQKANADPYYYSGSLEYYGLVYPDLGLIILDADALVLSASLYVTSSTLADSLTSDGWSLNCVNLFTAISGAASINSAYAFAARNEESISSTHYFVRVKNTEYNYTNNPTFVSGSYGAIRYKDFIDNPYVYITTVGLYNDSNELLAVAKLSRPLQKSFQNEALLKIRLDF